MTIEKQEILPLNKESKHKENTPEFIKFPWKRSDEPTDEEMEKFFTPDVISTRILFCPYINVDLTDDWGMFGYEEGFIYIEEMVREGTHCFNDLDWIEGVTVKDLGASVPVIPHYDEFPRNKFSHIRIINHDYPIIYKFLRNKLGNIKSLEDKK